MADTRSGIIGVGVYSEMRYGPMSHADGPMSQAQVVTAQAGIQWSASDDWVPAYAGMTYKWRNDRQVANTRHNGSMFFHGKVVAQ
jgi:hypothetical protein